MCCDVAHAEDKNISELINVFNNISWRIMANNKIVDEDKNSWITKQKYNESIVKVIAKAVADCITDKNEFANKNANDVITFNVTAKNYTKANWNAVVLWNYLHILKYDYLNNINSNQDEIFKELKTRICDNYPSEGVSNLEGKINRAIIDIKEYDKALSLKAEMALFNQVYVNTREATLETIIKNNTRITPIADWELVGANMPCKLKGADITTAKVNIADIRSLLLWNVSTSHFKGIFTPIKIKMDNGLYFVNEYNIWGSLRTYDFGKASYKIEEISKDVTLHGMRWRSDDYYKYKLDDLDIINKIESEVSTLFDGLSLTRLSR